MPPLRHETPALTEEQSERIDDIAYEAVVSALSVTNHYRFTQTGRLTMPKLLRVYNRNFVVPHIDYDVLPNTDPGQRKVRAWLERKPSERAARLYSRPIMLVVLEGSESWIAAGETELRATFSDNFDGNVGQGLNIESTNVDLLAAEDFETLVTETAETVDMISTSYFERVAAERPSGAQL